MTHTQPQTKGNTVNAHRTERLTDGNNWIIATDQTDGITALNNSRGECQTVPTTEWVTRRNTLINLGWNC